MKETVDFSKLISEATSGDDSAFEELYKLSLKTAYHTASLLLKNPDDVEDVLQNTYIKAYQKLPELKNPESFESWIKTIVENECKNYIKKEKRIHAPIIFFKNKTDKYSEEWNQPVPQEYMERAELRKSVSDIIDSLSPEVRTCIILFHYEDKSLNEISEMLNIPLGTVKSRLHNGRKQIEKEFSKLQKKDPSLYGIGAIPVILSLLSYQAKNIVVPAAISEGIITSVAGTVSATSSASAVGTATAVSAAASGTGAASSAATAVASIAVKVTAVAVAGSVAVGGTVAVKKHIDSKSDETTPASSTTLKVEEPCTVAEILTAILTTAEESTSMITSSRPSTETTTQTVTQISTASSAIQTAKSTTQKRTTKPSTTVTKPTTTEISTSTTKPSTTAAITTAPSTTQETTTEKATTIKPITTVPPTTSPENNYGSSGGVITEYTGSNINISIPSSIGSSTVTAIGSGAFAGNSDIRTVSIPSSVTQIGQEAFADCSSLTSVSLPSSLELIGIGAFYGCSDLTSVSIPNGTKTIGDEAFAQCNSLNSIIIPASVTSISDDAFDGCDSLTIRCKEGSVAHNYAVENNLNFNLI